MAIFIASKLGHRKAASFLTSRQKEPNFIDSKNVIWIHAASAGEGNQAIPIASELKKKYDVKVVISFFSPAGYNFHKNSKFFDKVLSIPLDTPKNAQNFINKLNPKCAIFIRNELWWNYLSELKQRNIPTFLINTPLSTLKSSNLFLKFYQSKCLNQFTKIYTTQKFDLDNDLSNKISSIYGDTKFESAFSYQVEPDHLIEQFIGNCFCLVIGSSWPKEESLLNEYLLKNPNQKMKVIIAPHEVHTERIKEIQNTFKASALYSEIDSSTKSTSNVLIIDSIGILRNCYQFCDLAIIGGGFGKGIHNTLEAITFNVPVLFGPNHKKFEEVSELIEEAIGFEFTNYNEFETLMNKSIKNNDKLKSRITQYVKQKNNIAANIVADIQKQINLGTLNLK